MSEVVHQNAEFYLVQSKNWLEKKDLLKFISNVSIAVAIADNPQMIAEAAYLKAKGLINFNQYEEALIAIDEALKYNNGEMEVSLLQKKGVAMGFLGNVNEARKIFTDLLDRTNNINSLVDVYTNLLWVSFSLEKNLAPNKLIEIKKYLAKIDEHYEKLSNSRKSVYLRYLSIYHYYLEEYEEAIEILEKSIDLCSEDSLANVYVNLAEYYFKAYDDIKTAEALDYLKKAEVIACKFNNNIDLGHIFFTKAKFEIRRDNLFSATDTLYLALAHFKDAHAYSQALECLEKINAIQAQCKNEWINQLIGSMKDTIENPIRYQSLKGDE